MCRLILYVIVFFCPFSFEIKSQDIIELGKNDSINIERSLKLANKILKNRETNTQYLIFAIGDKLLFIYDSCKVFNLYIITEKYNYIKQENEFVFLKRKQVSMNLKPLKTFWFCKKACTPLFVYSGSRDILSLHPSFIYFLMKGKGNKVCEFNIPIQNIGIEIPLNKKLLFYLLEELTPYLGVQSK